MRRRLLPPYRAVAPLRRGLRRAAAPEPRGSLALNGAIHQLSRGQADLAPEIRTDREHIFVNSELNIKRAQQRAVSENGLIQCVPDAFSYLSKILNSKVYDVCYETDLQYATKMSRRLGNRIFLKREDQQPIYSFKLRGAYNRIVQLSQDEKDRGLAACSAGNHAQGIAFSASKLGLSAKIFMPTITPSIKVDAVKSYCNDSSQVILVGDSYDEAYAECMRCVEVEGRVLVHPFNDPLVIAGQGVIGQEIIKQSTAEHIDAVFCCVGGGGLISGVGLYIKAVQPSIKIIGVEAADAPSMTESLRQGRVVELDSVGLFADGAAVKKVGDETFRVCQMVVDEMITVSTDEICEALKDTFVDTRVVLEPAGALAVAGMKKYTARTQSRGRTFVAVTSGANMDFDRLRFISERADQSETLISVAIPERPGSFLEFYRTIYPRNVTEFSYRIGQPHEEEDTVADICMSFQATSADDKSIVLEALERKGFSPSDLSHDEMAKTHGRNLIGGRAPESVTPGERLFRFEFPERPGALLRFLETLPNGVNVSLFHYRNHGSDVGKVLVGFLIPGDKASGDNCPQSSAFEAFMQALGGKGYRWREETDNVLYKRFLRTP